PNSKNGAADLYGYFIAFFSVLDRTTLPTLPEFLSKSQSTSDLSPTRRGITRSRKSHEMSCLWSVSLRLCLRIGRWTLPGNWSQPRQVAAIQAQRSLRQSRPTGLKVRRAIDEFWAKKPFLRQMESRHWVLMSNTRDQHENNKLTVNAALNHRASPFWRKPRRAIRLWLLCVLAMNGCQVARQTASLPGHVVTAVVPGGETTQPDPSALQSELLRYADDFTGRTTEGANEYARRVNTSKARAEALNWKLALDSCALGIATGANPTANLIDFLALSTITGAFLEQRASSSELPGAFDLWLENSRVLETNAWNIAEHVLTTDQQQEVRTNITRWLVQNAKEGAGFLTRPQALASGIRQSGEKEGKPGSVFGLVGLDPMSGLDPAVREVTRTRLFAERALYAMERMPSLVRLQTEVLTEQLL